jgi:hypothetical protein
MINLSLDIDFESDSSAMAGTSVRGHGIYPVVQVRAGRRLEVTCNKFM